MKVKLTLVGFPGSGKTAVCQGLKDRFGIPVADLDRKIEEAAGNTISDIIRVEGEDAFRALESQVLASLLKGPSDCKVVALGGGALLNAENRKLVSSHSFCIELRAPEEVLVERLLKDELSTLQNGANGPLRPVLVNDISVLDKQSMSKAVKQLKEKREGLYNIADSVVWTHAAELEQLSEIVKSEWEILRRQKSEVDHTITFPLSIQQKVLNQQLVTGHNILGSLESRIKDIYPNASRIALVVDENVLVHWEDALLNALSDRTVSVHRVKSGEGSKCFSTLEILADELLQEGLSRQDVIVACGGGVVGDLAGYLASSFMRGLGLIHVPTTLIAQVDSAIGGKTGLNLKGGKNLMGSFNPAPLTFCDSAFLSTLSDREYYAGLAEVVKYGLIGSKEFFDWLQVNSDKILLREKNCLREILEYCGRAKLEIVALDLEDRLGKRALLNFGHTLGHAVENLAGYGKYLHGEAVAIGMVFALALGEEMGFGDVNIVSKATDLLSKLQLPTCIPDFLLSQEILPDWRKSLLADKKKRNSNTIDYIFVKEIGVAATVETEMETVVKAIEKRMC